MTKPMEGETWRDERGVVRVTWVNVDPAPFAMGHTETRIGYIRDGQGYMLGLRRFLRDFKRHVPFPSDSRREPFND